jgi:HptB-dependent secretion and biofilm anti anti-sigma factor
MSDSSNEFNVSVDNDSINISINIERFDFNAYSSFRKTYTDLSSGSRYKIDFSQVRFLDSTALGMLLMFREYNGTDNKFIQFINCSKEIVDILRVANFDQLFVLNN